MDLLNGVPHFLEQTLMGTEQSLNSAITMSHFWNALHQWVEAMTNNFSWVENSAS